jgi:hypothetical protein
MGGRLNDSSARIAAGHGAAGYIRKRPIGVVHWPR